MNAILEQYKVQERAEHIVPDDVLNKVTQEVMELLTGIQDKDTVNIYEEAGDILANVFSFYEELGLDPRELFSVEKSQNPQDIPSILGKWNEEVQALRGRYSRKIGNREDVQSLTKSFISTLLNYTHPEKNLAEVLEGNLVKLSQRKNMYKPDIKVKDYIANYPDFPKPGIQFKDISPLLASSEALRYVCLEMAESCRGADKIVALDARGFIFAPMIAQTLGIPWVMMRKKGKLPGETVEYSYDLEYGNATIEVQKDAIQSGEKIAIVDDLLATGGTALAAAKLTEQLGGIVHNCSFVIGLDEDFLKGFQTRKELEKYNISSVVSYN